METTQHGDITRQHILKTAFREVHSNGFRATSLNDILKRAGLTKGAFYHHFENKLALGYALVDELLKNIVMEVWLKPLETCDNPIDCQIGLLTSAHNADDVVLKGCPLNNLAVEMAPVDEGFRQRLNQVYDMWITVLAGSLSRGQLKGFVRKDIDTHETATFIVASMAGCFSLAKNSQSLTVLAACTKSLELYLESLR